jgi:hypothetical protein
MVAVPEAARHSRHRRYFLAAVESSRSPGQIRAFNEGRMHPKRPKWTPHAWAPQMNGYREYPGQESAGPRSYTEV